MNDEYPIYDTPEIVHACDFVRFAWFANNHLSYVNHPIVERLRRELDSVRVEFSLKVMPEVIERQKGDLIP